MILRGVICALVLFGSARADAFEPGVRAEMTPVDFGVSNDARVEFRGALAISPPFSGFGGVSGLAALGPRDFVAVTDRGLWLRLSIEIANGWLADRVYVSRTPILDGFGDPVVGGGQDAEDLTILPDTGALMISFESDHRIWRVDAPGGIPHAGLRHPGWAGYSINTGIEALARDAEDRIWGIKEQSRGQGWPFPVFVWDSGSWVMKALPRPTKHAVTGAAFGPDGWMYLTQRDFSFANGFDFRLRRVRWDEGAEPVEDELLLELSAESGIDNIEAIEVWEEDGEIRILLASDDNFFPLQRNILALFVLRE